MSTGSAGSGDAFDGRFDKDVRIRFVRTASFAAAHRYFNPSLSEDENRRLYGTYYREAGFGHNFLVEAHFEGPIDPMTGMIVNLTIVDQWLKEVLSSLDHKTMNDLPFFTKVSPTPERIALYIFKDIESRAAGTTKLAKVRLYEGDDLWVDIEA